MESETLRSRLHKLVQKSRQAFRLYDSMGRNAKGDSAEFAEMQAAEWRAVNGQLIKELGALLNAPHAREISTHVFSVRARLWNEFRAAETELHRHQRELLSVSEKGDFIKAALLSRDLVTIKAKLQATQAAHHEIDEVITKSRLTPPPILLAEESMQVQHDDVPAPITRMAKVIPLRK